MEGGGKSKYRVTGNFGSQTFMCGKGRWRYIGALAYVVFGLLNSVALVRERTILTERFLHLLLDDVSKTRSVSALRQKRLERHLLDCIWYKELSSNHWI